MKKISSCLLMVFSILSLTGCQVLKNSTESTFTKFEYSRAQPGFQFTNPATKISGAWNWATNARALPSVQYLPGDVRSILMPIARKHGKVLLQTWPGAADLELSSGFDKSSKLQVAEKAAKGKPLFLVVLNKNLDFDTKNNPEYASAGKSENGDFNLYQSIPKNPGGKYWTMEIVAARPKHYYNFVCVLDSAFMNTNEDRRYQAEQFLEDVKTTKITAD